MSDEQSSNKPSHIAYQVTKGDDGKAYFKRVGSAFRHEDGQGFDLSLDTLPVSGEVTLSRKAARNRPMAAWISVICERVRKLLVRRRPHV